MAAAVRDNPIRKVVTLLQNLREEVETEGRKDKELFDKFMCYCTDNMDKLEKSVEVARADIGEFEATIKELTGSNAALELEIKDVEEDLEENKKAIADATGVRTKEKAEFTKESSETATAISSLDKAIPAIEKGTAPAEALAQERLGDGLLGRLGADPRHPAADAGQLQGGPRGQHQVRGGGRDDLQRAQGREGEADRRARGRAPREDDAGLDPEGHAGGDAREPRGHDRRPRGG